MPKQFCLPGACPAPCGQTSACPPATPSSLEEALDLLVLESSVPAAPATSWVPVLECLPEVGKDVIAWHCEPTDPRQPHSMVARLVLKHPRANEPGFYDNYGNCWLASRFSHWMPLPTPPAL